MILSAIQEKWSFRVLKNCWKLISLKLQMYWMQGQIMVILMSFLFMFLASSLLLYKLEVASLEMPLDQPLRESQGDLRGTVKHQDSYLEQYSW